MRHAERRKRGKQGQRGGGAGKLKLSTEWYTDFYYLILRYYL